MALTGSQAKGLNQFLYTESKPDTRLTVLDQLTLFNTR